MGQPESLLSSLPEVPTYPPGRAWHQALGVNMLSKALGGEMGKEERQNGSCAVVGGRSEKSRALIVG